MSDAAKRCSETVNMHLIADPERAVNSWVAIRLSDGSSDNTLYDTKQAAVNHQIHETQCAYIMIPPTGMTLKQAENFLKLNRQLYAAGMRLSDPDKQVIGRHR